MHEQAPKIDKDKNQVIFESMNISKSHIDQQSVKNFDDDDKLPLSQL